MSPAGPDPFAVLSALGFSPAGEVERITTGWDTLTCRFTTADGRAHALRLHRSQPDAAANAAAAAHEALAMRSARAAGIPVPEVEFLGSWEDRPALVTAWVEGETLLHIAGASPRGLPAVATAMGREHARLHAVPAWIRDQVAHPGLRDALLREGRFDTFCHLDLHPINVIAAGGRIAGILDWSFSAVCDRRADVAFTSTALRLVPLPPSPWRPAFQVARRVFHHYWRKGYEREAGAVPLEPLFLAFGAWHYVRETERAVADGRGWVTPAQLETLRNQRDEAFTEAGLA